MHPIAFHIGPKPIYWYGILVATGFIFAIVNWSVYTRKEGYPKGTGSDLGFWIMLVSVIGARINYVIANFSTYREEPLTMIRIDQGGLIFYGGLAGGIAAVIGFTLIKRYRLWKMGDAGIMGLLIGHAIGRFGCFMNGCCYGEPTDGPFGILFTDVPRHAIQLYESGGLLAIYLFLVWWYPRKKFDGQIVALYCFTYPVLRFLTELLRGDERQTFAGLHAAQIISILLFLTGAGIWVVLQQARHRSRSSGSCTRNQTGIN